MKENDLTTTAAAVTKPGTGPALTGAAQALPDRSLITLMAVTCGLVVANIYYNQPLLAEMAAAFGVSEKKVSWIATATQVGYTLGLLFMIPLGDKQERKRLVLLKVAGAALFMLLAGLSRSFYWMAAASLLIGIFSAVPQLLLPMAAHIAPAAQRGRIVGKVMSGLLIGILLSRTLSGYIGAHYGWRAMFFIGSGMMAVLLVLLALKLPRDQPSFTGSYASLMRSLFTLARTLPVLRRSALTGMLMFAAFSAFWTTLVFFLEGAPYYYKSDVAGLFGAIGACGALAAPLAGRYADKRGAQFTLRLGVLAALAAFAVMGFAGAALTGLIAGVILLDIGQQVTHISNQSKVFALLPEARSRLNTVYMTSSFAGGSLGSFLGAQAWSYAHWTGVCILGAVLVALALLVNSRR